MNKIFIALLISAFYIVNINAQEAKREYTILLTGASFASSNNGWFELACKHLNATPINRAVEGEAIADTANKMFEDKLYTTAELDEIDAFVIMQVHEKDVADLSQIKTEYTDYKSPFDRSNYAGAYDYVIKKYITECYNQKYNKSSKYYNSPAGKPAVVVLSTHWHDSRVIYNSAIRILADRWGFPLIEFDKNIGFSRTAIHPVTKEQTGKLFTDGNNEKTHDVEYGWHPEKGQDKYIQQRMASIFADSMKKVLPLR